MKYKIRIDEVVENTVAGKYPNYQEIYSQTLDDLNIESVVAALNSEQFKSPNKLLFVTADTEIV